MDYRSLKETIADPDVKNLYHSSPVNFPDVISANPEVQREFERDAVKSFENQVKAAVRQASKGGDAEGDKNDETDSQEVVPLAAQEVPAGGPRIVINPTTFKNKKDALCVAFNERFRIAMEQYGWEPQSEPTDAQRRFFADTPYADDELQLRRTIIARILTLDTSVKDPTDDQIREAFEFLQMFKENEQPSNEWEARAIDKIARLLEATVNSIPAKREEQPLPPNSEPLEPRGGQAAIGGGETDDKKETVDVSADEISYLVKNANGGDQTAEGDGPTNGGDQTAEGDGSTNGLSVNEDFDFEGTGVDKEALASELEAGKSEPVSVAAAGNTDAGGGKNNETPSAGPAYDADTLDGMKHEAIKGAATNTAQIETSAPASSGGPEQDIASSTAAADTVPRSNGTFSGKAGIGLVGNTGIGLAGKTDISLTGKTDISLTGKTNISLAGEGGLVNEASEMYAANRNNVMSADQAKEMYAANGNNVMSSDEAKQMYAGNRTRLAKRKKSMV